MYVSSQTINIDKKIIARTKDGGEVEDSYIHPQPGPPLSMFRVTLLSDLMRANSEQE